LPAHAALYGGDSLQEGASSAGITGENLCVEISASLAERRSEALGPRRVIRADRPDIVFTVSESNLSGAGPKESDNADRSPASKSSAPREHTVLGNISDPEGAASCGAPNLPNFEAVAEVKGPSAPTRSGVRSYVTTTITDSTPWDNNADLSPYGTSLPPKTSIAAEAPVNSNAGEASVPDPLAGKPESSPDQGDPAPRLEAAPVTLHPLRIPKNITASIDLNQPWLRPDIKPDSRPENPSSVEPPESDAPHRPPYALPPDLADALPREIRPGTARHLLEKLAERERRQEFYESLLEAREAVQDAAAADESTLSELYRDITIETASERLEEAEHALTLQSEQITAGKSTLPEGEKIRFSQIYRNAAEKARLARQFTKDLEHRNKTAEENAKIAGNNPMLNFLLSPSKGENPLALSKELAELLGRKPAPTSHDGLTQRLILLNGLPPEPKKAAQKKLKLSERLRFSIPKSGTVELPLLHNGYLLGGGDTGLDCSSFISAALPADIRKGRFTTWDFRTMWSYRRTGVPPKIPKYEPQRLELVLATAEAFEALDVYRGEEPGMGDLLIHRLPWEATGHAFVVREYHRDTKIASVIEAAQSAGTIREREFPLSLDPLTPPGTYTKKLRAIRPGLMVLRLKPVRQQACRFRKPQDALRAPAGLPQAGDGASEPLKSQETPPLKGGGW